MEPEEAKSALAKLLLQAPKREEFQSEAAFEEATIGFKHRAGPSIRTLQSLASRVSSKSQDTAK